jgi:hypothetical protein
MYDLISCYTTNLHLQQNIYSVALCKEYIPAYDEQTYIEHRTIDWYIGIVGSHISLTAWSIICESKTLCQEII